MIVISEIEIKNYKNLKEIKLADLRSLNILTGPNGSGKTNLLEFLWTFSQEFSPTDGGSSITQDSWWQRSPIQPLEIKLKISYDEENLCKDLLPEKLLKVMVPLQIVIHRILESPRGAWITKLLEINGLTFVKIIKPILTF
jgi:ABC-type branched-subunit amino acid transport system ATPase component